MANKNRGEVGVKFKSKRLVLDLGFDALCELEEHFDEDISTIADRFALIGVQKKPALKYMRAVLWASMLKSMPDAELSDASQLATALGADFAETIINLFNESGLFDVPDGDDEEGGAQGNAPSSAG